MAEYDSAAVAIDVLHRFEDGVAVDESVDNWVRALGIKPVTGFVGDEKGVVVCEVGNDHAPYVASGGFFSA